MKSVFKFSFLIITITSILTINTLKWAHSGSSSAKGTINQAVIAVGGEAEDKSKGEDDGAAGEIVGDKENQTAGNTTLKAGGEQDNQNKTSTDQEDQDDQDIKETNQTQTGQSEEQKQIQQNLREAQIQKIKDAAAKFEGNVNSQIDQTLGGLTDNVQNLKLASDSNQTEGNQTQGNQTGEEDEGKQEGSEAQGAQDNQTQGNQTKEDQAGEENEDEQTAGSNNTANVDQDQEDDDDTVAVGQGAQKGDQKKKKDESCDLDNSNYSKKFLKEKSPYILKSHQSSSSSDDDDDDSCFD